MVVTQEDLDAFANADVSFGGCQVVSGRKLRAATEVATHLGI